MNCLRELQTNEIKEFRGEILLETISEILLQNAAFGIGMSLKSLREHQQSVRKRFNKNRTMTIITTQPEPTSWMLDVGWKHRISSQWAGGRFLQMSIYHFRW